MDGGKTVGFDRDNILEQIEKNIPTECTECRERLYFKGSGKYMCPRCRKIYYDDFGRVKEYLEEHGSAPVIEIAQNTGVSLEVIDALFEEGRLEMPKELREAERCERCGALFPVGRYCKECIENTSKGMMKIFSEEEANSFETKLKTSVQTLALVLGRDWQKDLEKFKDCF